MSFSRLTSAFLFVLCLSVAPLALGEELSADQIAAKMVRGDAFAWEGARAKVRMVLTSKNGSQKSRSMEVLGRRDKGLFQTIVRFLAPADVAGTAFLMLERSGKASEQYVYLSGLKRTRRIVGREQEGSFMGSDFSYADMQPLPKKYATHTRLADDSVGSTSTYVIQTDVTAKAPSSYSKVMTWVRKTDLVALRTRFFDKKGKLQKTLYARKVKKIEGEPVIVEARMQNQQNGHMTELFVDSVKREEAMSGVSFTPKALEHM